MFAGHAASYDDMLVAAAPGTTAKPAAREPDAAFPQLSVRSAEAHDRFTLDGLKQFISIIKTILLVFGFIAIFVGAFTIYNTLSITVAQRARELATLRTVGASRRQVLGSVVTESAVVALVGSAVGDRARASPRLPACCRCCRRSASTCRARRRCSPRTRSSIAGLVGLIVTMVSGLVPALRATRVAPVTTAARGLGAQRGQALPQGRDRVVRVDRARAG